MRSASARMLISACLVVVSTDLHGSTCGPAGLVEDIRTDISDAPGSSPRDFVAFNGMAFFRADDGRHGPELWKSDGTDAGTVMVADISPGPSGSEPFLTEVDGTLFRAYRGTATELWKTDGTEAGTLLVKDIQFGGSPAGGLIHPVRSFTAVDGTLFFVVDDGVTGAELWKSDGTEAGTVLVKDIFPGASGSTPEKLTNVNGTLFFSADDGVTGRELWKSDGTEAGTVLVKDIGSGNASPDELTDLNGTLFFRAEHGYPIDSSLWKSDGTEAGTVMVKNIQPYCNTCGPENIVVSDATLFFRGGTFEYGGELWKSDGTEAGTVMVKDIYPGPDQSVPSRLTVVNETLFFIASLGDLDGEQLWRSDGTEAGTFMVKENHGVDCSSCNPRDLTAFNGTLVFRSAGLGHGVELWKSDGTEAGTVMVKDIFPGENPPGEGNSSWPSYLTAVGDTLFFSATDGVNGTEPWSSDGTEAGTVMIKNIQWTTASNPSNLTQVNDTLFFIADDGVYGKELWTSDGTAQGTLLVEDLGNQWDTPPTSLTPVNGILFFIIGHFSNQLWRSDGTAAGTYLVADIGPELHDPYVREMTAVNDTLFFSADDGGTAGRQLWKSNGTAAGTGPVANVSPMDLTAVNDLLFFVADHPAFGRELWKSDGTQLGTRWVKDIRPLVAGSNPDSLIDVDGTLFFFADDGVVASDGEPHAGRWLWTSDGTEFGTEWVPLWEFDPDDRFPPWGLVASVGGALAFTVPTWPDDFALWKSDGAYIYYVKSFSMVGATQPVSLVASGDLVFFDLANAVTGRELWVSNGQGSGTLRLKAFDSIPRYLTDVDGTLFFTAEGEGAGNELWRSDGTQAGTVLVQDINAGPYSSAPSGLTAVNRTLFFSADDDVVDRELWAMRDFDFDGIGDRCETGAALADANLSSRVDGFDLMLLAMAFGSQIGEPAYNPHVDFDRDQMIDGQDLALLASSFGQFVD